MRILPLFVCAVLIVPAYGQDEDEPFLPVLSNSRVEALWLDPAKATIRELYSAAFARGAAKDWEQAVFFLWCSQVRRRFETAIFPPKGRGGDDPTLPLFPIEQVMSESFVPLLYSSPEAHRRALAHFRRYVPDCEDGYRPWWSYDTGIAKSEAQANAKKFVAQFADLSARVLELTAIPEYLQTLKVYADLSDNSPERGRRFRAANETMWRIENAKGIKSGLAYPPITPDPLPEPTPMCVTSPARHPRFRTVGWVLKLGRHHHRPWPRFHARAWRKASWDRSGECPRPEQDAGVTLDVTLVPKTR